MIEIKSGSLVVDGINKICPFSKNSCGIWCPHFGELEEDSILRENGRSDIYCEINAKECYDVYSGTHNCSECKWAIERIIQSIKICHGTVINRFVKPPQDK